MDNVVSEEFLLELDSLISSLPLQVSSFDEADMYASKFLKAAGNINSVLRQARNSSIPLKQLKEIEFANACAKSNKSTGEAQKRNAILDVDFQDAEKKYLEAINLCEYLDNLYKTFIKAHEYYKGVARDK